MMESMVTDEEIERAIRRDPRMLVRIFAILGIAIVGGALAFSWFAGLDLGRFVAKGFSSVTESPPPAPAEDR